MVIAYRPKAIPWVNVSMEMTSLLDFVFFRRFLGHNFLGFLNWGVPPPSEVHFKRFSLSLSLMLLRHRRAV